MKLQQEEDAQRIEAVGKKKSTIGTHKDCGY
jgi:hypothetical protein